MQLAVRLILILFLSALVLLNINSIRILNLSLTLLNQEAKERTALSAQQLALDLTSEHPQETNPASMKNYVRTKMAQLDCDAVVLANAVGQPGWQVFGNVPPEIHGNVLNPAILRQL